jgi:hypothetical protein
MHCFLENALQSITFWMNFKDIFFSYYIEWLWMILVIFNSFNYFKDKLIVVSNKNLYSTFLME